MQARVRRGIALFLLALLLWSSWGGAPVAKRPRGRHPILVVSPQQLPPRTVLERYLGPFRMEGAWQIRSSSGRVFGYSALVPGPGGNLLAFSDAGNVLLFAPPGAALRRPVRCPLRLTHDDRSGRDVESIAHDPKTGRFWAGVEGTNRIVRLSSGFRETGSVAPAGMKGWGINSGAEAMARLPDGRFVAIREITTSLTEPRLHEALLFPGDPVDHHGARSFRFDGPDNFSVVDMALLPDGRALILMRRLLWVFPMRFAGRIVIADTARIRPGGIWRSAPLASLASVLPVDNFEAIAAVPQPDGRIAVWLMSDDNDMRVLQRTLLWKLSADPVRLPWPR